MNRNIELLYGFAFLDPFMILIPLCVMGRSTRVAGLCPLSPNVAGVLQSDPESGTTLTQSGFQTWSDV